jgi:hypothetical protein
MTCTGCKLEWAFAQSGTVLRHGVFNVVTGYGGVSTSPIMHLGTSGGTHWGTIQATVTNASHGACATGLSGYSGCAPITACAGLRGAATTLDGGYQFNIVSYTANTINPFVCGSTEHVTFYGTFSGTQICSPYTLSISCGDC